MNKVDGADTKQIPVNPNFTVRATHFSFWPSKVSFPCTSIEGEVVPEIPLSLSVPFSLCIQSVLSYYGYKIDHDRNIHKQDN